MKTRIYESSLLKVDYSEVNDIRYSSEYYVVEPIQYEILKDKLAVKKIGEIEESFQDIDKQLVAKTEKPDRIPTYREVSKEGKEGIDLSEGETLDFIIDPVASFNTSVEREDSLASSPLGIYHLAPIIHVEDGKRTEMTPTYSPGGFVSAPAGGVTNIQAAEKVKGNQPIDAIRVRVAGITHYTPEAKMKIEQFVQDIEEMGLIATVIAGASPRMMQIEVEGIGLVEEAWTSLGAAGSIISQWNVTNLILTIAFLLVTVTYIYHRMRIWQTQKQEDVSLFVQLGWERTKILRLMGGEIALLTFIAWIVSLGALWVINKQLNFSQLVFYIQAIVSLFTILILIMLAAIQLKTRRKEKAEKVIKPKREWKSLVAKNIYYYRKQITSPFIQLVIVSGLSSFVYLSLTKTVTQTNLTILGEYINTRTSDWHLILIVGAYVLATITLIESITSVMISKKKEIATYLSIGWKLSHIFKLYFKEIAIWTGTALVLGSIGSFLLYAVFYPLQLDSILILLATFVGFYVLILALSAIVLQNYLKKNIGDSLLLRRRKVTT